MTEYEQAVIEVFRESLSTEVSGIDVDLIEVGILDSLGLVVLISDLEERFGVRIPFERLEVEQLSSVRSLAGLIEAQARGS